MAFFDRNDAKDLFDLYFLIKKEKFTPQKLLKLVEKKFSVKFSESAFWSESFKSFEKLGNLMQFLIAENDKEKGKILDEIKEYFTKNSKQFLDKQFN